MLRKRHKNTKNKVDIQLLKSLNQTTTKAPTPRFLCKFPAPPRFHVWVFFFFYSSFWNFCTGISIIFPSMFSLSHRLIKWTKTLSIRYHYCLLVFPLETILLPEINEPAMGSLISGIPRWTFAIPTDSHWTYFTHRINPFGHFTPWRLLQLFLFTLNIISCPSFSLRQQRPWRPGKNGIIG